MSSPAIEPGAPAGAADTRDQTDTGKLWSAPLAGRHVYLRPVFPEDYRLLQAAETTGDLALRWRFRGTTPSPELWAQRTWSGVLAQFLVVGRQRNEPIGIVACYQANFQDGHAYLAAARLTQRSRAPAVILGFALFVQYIFTNWTFRKLYMELPEYNYPQFSSGVDRFFNVEGRLRDHIFVGGRYWDQLLLALYRERWDEAGQRLLRGELSADAYP